MISILIVEDNLLDLRRCTNLLGRMSDDMKIHKAESGGQAYNIISNGNIDAALIDIEMPGMDGLELAYRMRKANKTRFFPIVFITATDNDTLEAYRSYHHSGYIKKPYTDDEFMSVMNPFIKGVIAHQNERKIPKITFEIIPEENETSNIVNVTMAVDDILYVETIRRITTIVTFDNTYRIKKKNLKQIIDEINDDDFLQCHRKCYVNRNKIHSVRNVTYKLSDIYLTKDGNIKCPLAYNYKNDIQKNLLGK